MPYKKYVKKWSKRKSTYSKKRKYFKNRSSKSQAGQLYRLDKKVRRISKGLQGEKHTYYVSNGGTDYFQNWSTATDINTVKNATVSCLTLRSGILYAYIHSTTVYVNFRLLQPNTYSATESGTSTVFARLIFCRMKSATGSPPTPQQIFGSRTDQMTVFNGPLQEDITNAWVILKDVKIKLTADYPSYNRKFKFRIYKKWEDTATGNVDENTVYCVYKLFNLEAPRTTNYCDFGLQYKVVYTQPQLSTQ